jgi:hypothetical protein
VLTGIKPAPLRCSQITASRLSLAGFERRYNEDSSFSEEKEAKRLLFVVAPAQAGSASRGGHWKKSFCFFFSRKRRALPFLS